MSSSEAKMRGALQAVMDWFDHGSPDQRKALLERVHAALEPTVVDAEVSDGVVQSNSEGVSAGSRSDR